MKKKSNLITTILLVVILLAGLSLLLYPTVSNYWNSLHQSQSIVDYDDQVNSLQQEEYRRLWQAAEDFNAAILERADPFRLTEAQQADYDTQLDPSGAGLMGYVEIPVIDAILPIRHGTGEDVLQKAVGHLEWSSLPVGGESTHCVISGHRGLPSAELLTNIDHMEKGDLFYIHVLGEKLTYQVDQIAVVEPDDFSLLGITEGEDYVTLLTCTPYGINSHRLLVRGTRLPDGETPDRVDPSNEVRTVDPMYLIPVVLAAAVVVVVIVLLAGGRKKKKGASPDEEVE